MVAFLSSLATLDPALRFKLPRDLRYNTFQRALSLFQLSPALCFLRLELLSLSY